MKKIILLFSVLGIIVTVGSNQTEKEKNNDKEKEIRAVFISYIELSEYIKKDSIEMSKRNIKQIVKNCKNMNLNTIILHTVISSDAIYPSNVYPFSSYVSIKEGEYTFDILKYFREETRKQDIKLISWINPYRIRTTSNLNTITEKSPAYPYLNTNTIFIKDGIYWNPAKKEVEDFILKVVKEILKYEVDGILMDDYFYPDDNIDKEEFDQNKENLTKEEFHLNIINHMVRRVYEECKRNNTLFGISPDGNINNNYKIHYADVKRWMKEDGYIDFIMPQIYYGFYNSIRGFNEAIKEWESLIKKEDLFFIPALAFYKIGKIDSYAKEGREEWIYHDNIIMREVIVSRNKKNYKGFSLFRYDNIFNNQVNTNSIEEIENLKKLIN